MESYKFEGGDEKRRNVNSRHVRRLNSGAGCRTASLIKDQGSTNNKK